MSFCKLALASLLVIAGPACAQGASCPAYQEKNRLVTVTLFDGPPSEMASLMPDVSKGSGDHAYASWDVGYIFDAGRSLYLACEYSGSKKTTAIKVEKKVQQCTYRTHAAPKPVELNCK
jgi:hypothetical protein